jgi:hypothetical protein
VELKRKAAAFASSAILLTCLFAGIAAAPVSAAPIGAPTGLTATPQSCAPGGHTYEVSALTTHSSGAPNTGETQPSGTAAATTTTNGSSATVAWTAVPGASGYDVYISDGGVFSRVTAASPTTTTNSFTDTQCTHSGPAPKVSSYNQGGGGNSTDMNFPGGFKNTGITPSGGTGGFTAGDSCAYGVSTLGLGPAGAPQTGESNESSTVTVLIPTSTATTSFSWTAVAGATGYIVYRDCGGTAKDGHFVIGNSATTTFTDTGATPPASNLWYTFLEYDHIPPPSNATATANNTPGTLAPATYCYEVSATDAGGETVASAPLCATLAATGDIAMAWSTVSGATGYNIYGRPADPGGAYGLIGSSTTASFTDLGTTSPGAPPPTADTGTGRAVPTLSASASPGGAVGDPIHDTATLGSAVTPGGGVTFSLYGPDDASCGTPAFTDHKAVSDNGTYQSADFTPTAPGAYRWIASYSGDANNLSHSTACGDAGQSAEVSPNTKIHKAKINEQTNTATFTFGATDAAKRADAAVGFECALIKGKKKKAKFKTCGSPKR